MANPVDVLTWSSDVSCSTEHFLRLYDICSLLHWLFVVKTAGRRGRYRDQRVIYVIQVIAPLVKVECSIILLPPPDPNSFFELSCLDVRFVCDDLGLPPDDMISVYHMVGGRGSREAVLNARVCVFLLILSASALCSSNRVPNNLPLSPM